MFIRAVGMRFLPYFNYFVLPGLHGANILNF